MIKLISRPSQARPSQTNPTRKMGEGFGTIMHLSRVSTKGTLNEHLKCLFGASQVLKMSRETDGNGMKLLLINRKLLELVRNYGK